MINNQNSRRSFLSSIAILSAGAAFGSFTDFISPGNSSTDLKQLWNSFCTQNNGYPLISSGTDKTVMDTCKGHYPKIGKMIYFSKENLLAQPAWIYWGENKSQPADIIITFYHNDKEQTKAFRVNRFELEGLIGLTAGTNENGIITGFKENNIEYSPNGIRQKGLMVKTTIQKGIYAKIFAANSTNKITIDSKLIYNS